MAAGHTDLMVVGWKDSDRQHADALLAPSEPGVLTWLIARWALRLGPYVGRIRGAGRVAHALWHIPTRLSNRGAERRRLRARAEGREDFEYPATWNLLNRLPLKPDILHLHNLHGGYFDLRALPWLTRRVPTVITLHDAWLLSGHCAHSLGCERWRSGCGECPDLTIYPEIERDATAFNWERKRRIFQRSRFHITAPAQYLIDMAKESILKPAILSARAIPNGIDVDLFSPGGRNQARRDLGIPEDAAIMVFVASSFLNNRFKDWPTIRRAAEVAAARMTDRPVMLVGIGDSATDETVGNLTIRHAGTIKEPATLVVWYRAADLCIHAARGESFCVAILEGRACGAPTVATAVDGIPEQVKSLTDRYTACRTYSSDEATGILVGRGDAAAMGDACAMLLRDDALRARVSANAVRDARERFSNERMVQAYLELYAQAVEAHRGTRCEAR